MKMSGKSRKRRLLRRFFCMLAAVLLLTGIPSGAVAAQDKTYQIGIIRYPGLAYENEDGTVLGAEVEMAYQIAQYADIHVQVHLYDDMDTEFADLDSGVLDMMFDVGKTPEREEKYLLSEQTETTSALTICVREDNDSVDYGDTEQMKQLIYGVQKDSYVTDYFQQWCEKHGFTPEYREYASLEEQKAALNNGEVTALLLETGNNPDFKEINQLSNLDYYIAFRQQDTQLKRQVDDALSEIYEEDPMIVGELVKKYTMAEQTEMAAFTEEEKTYIADHPEITVAVLENDAPFYSCSSKGEESGVLPDFYSQLAARTGLRFRFQAYATQDQAIEALQNGEVDVIGMYSDGIIAAQNAKVRMTAVYGSASGVLITKNGTDNRVISRIAVKQRSMIGIKTMVSEEIGSKLVPYNTAKECFEALKAGKVDAVLTGMPSATWTVNQTDPSAYSMTTMSSVTMNMCGATAYHNAILCSILNKAIENARYNYDSILTNNTVQEESLFTYIERLPAVWLIAFATTMLAMILLLGVALIMLIRRQKEKTAVLAEKAENARQKARLDEIEKNTREKNMLFSNISHDMRTPLNAIIGFSSLAEKEEISAKAADYLAKIRLSGSLLLALIDDTLTISRYNSGKLQLKAEPAEVEEICHAVEIPIREAAKNQGISFLTDYQGIHGCRILADRLNLEKILLNLLTNAVKYTPGGGHVWFRVYAVPADGSMVQLQIQVEDDGIGMSGEFLQHLFEPFVQEQKQGYQGKGTGLGLAIVKNLVEAMKGTVAVTSTEGKGTCFRLEIPFRADETEMGEAAQKELSSGSAVKETKEEQREQLIADARQHLAGKTILLCEDNDLNREIAEAVLKKIDIHVNKAVNGLDGVLHFEGSRTGEIAAILMDIRMPIMDGYQAAEKIRELDRADAKTVPIIAMTADAFPEDVERCMQAGMNGHIAKPFEAEQLYQALEELVQN